MKFADLHTHTFYSDGELSPAELAYRALSAGYAALGITDHADYSNLDSLIHTIQPAARRLSVSYGIQILSGVELTYIPPSDLPRMIKEARWLGADIVIVHGETPAENVPPGTNLAAVKAGCDILAHPGMITREVADIAAENRVFLELTTRRGHRVSNPHIARVAMEAGADLVINTDSHSPDDLLNKKKIDEVLEEISMEKGYYETLLQNSLSIAQAAFKKRNRYFNEKMG